MERITYLINGIEVILELQKKDPVINKIRAGTDIDFIRKYFQEMIENGELDDHGFSRHHDPEDLYIEKFESAPEEIVQDSEEDLIEKMILLIEQRPALYDYTIPITNRSKTIRDRLWNEVYSELGGQINLKEIPKKWKSLRDRYLRLKGKKFPSGSAADGTPTWKYYHQMSFIDQGYENQQTSSSISLNSPASGSSTSSSKKKKTDDSDERFFKALENLNSQRLDEVDYFSLRLSSGLKRLSADVRSKLEISFLQQLYDAEYINICGET